MDELKFTIRDAWQLEELRLHRFRQVIGSKLKHCSIALLLNNTLLIVCLSETAYEPLLSNFVDLRYQAWLTTGADKLSISHNGAIKITSSTRPQFSLCDGNEPGLKKESKLKNNLSGTSGASNMTAATLTPPASEQVELTDNISQSEQPVVNSTISTRPKLINLNALAGSNGIDPGFAAAEIERMGGLVGYDEEAQAFKTTQPFWEKFVNWYVATIRDRLLGTTTQVNSTVAPETTAQPATTAANNGKVTKSRRGGVRFKDFVKSNSYTKTLGTFLTNQGWDDAKRIETLEAIAALPEVAGDGDTFAEKCIAKILTKYPEKGKHDQVRKGLIAAAKQTSGNPES